MIKHGKKFFSKNWKFQKIQIQNSWATTCIAYETCSSCSTCKADIFLLKTLKILTCLAWNERKGWSWLAIARSNFICKVCFHTSVFISMMALPRVSQKRQIKLNSSFYKPFAFVFSSRNWNVNFIHISLQGMHGLST